MATTWTKNVNVAPSVGSYQGFSGSVNDTGNTATVVNQLQFPANSNSVSFTLNFNSSGLQQLFFVATQNCTINTNNANSPTNTINLIAGAPLTWSRSEGYFGNPINANTNAAFLTCNAAVLLTYGVLTT